MKRFMEIGVCLTLGIGIVYLTLQTVVTSFLLYRLLSWL